ncbi:MAG: B12-binding domain-containing radical SAM protein, partial [Deltaproteobacteria bacterium]|nr:B12-binding domain-containing radical SAM protein [Deltaproteobacteria bacterium]
VASLLPREWDLKVADLTAGELTEDDWSQCDAVMVTGMVNQGSGMFETIKEGKRRGKMVVAGGPLVFHLPDDSLSPWVDIIVRGEAEEIAASLVSAMKRRERGVVIRATNWPDMSASPPPRYDLLDMGLYTDMVVQFSRGCPFLCEFCDITLMFGRKVRTKAPEQILAELQILYDLGWRRAVFFVDDNFIGSTNRAKELLRKLIPWMEDRGHPFDFMTQASVNLGKDDELLDLMARAGFHSVFLGIESTDKKSLILTKKFQNAATDLDLACQKINSAGLKVVAGCIIGFDNEEPGADQRLIDFANRNQIPEMFVTMLQAGPGTGLFKRLQAEGRVGVLELTDHLGSQTGLINFEPS